MSGGALQRDPWPWRDLDPEALGDLVSAHLPSSRRCGLEPTGAGDFCVAYRTGAWIVRVAKHRQAADAIRREACVLGRVADRLPLEVPRLEYCEPDGCPPFTMHREVPGAELTRAAWAELPETARVSVAERLAAFLQQLHGLAGDTSACGLHELNGAALARRLRGPARDLVGVLGRGVAARLDDFLASRDGATSAARPLALLHADLAPGHLLYEQASGELTGVIDFGDVVLGPAARDFIFLYEDFGVERCEEVLAAYAGLDAPALMEEVRAWYLLEALAWTLERLQEGAHGDVAHGVAEIARELGA